MEKDSELIGQVNIIPCFTDTNNAPRPLISRIPSLQNLGDYKEFEKLDDEYNSFWSQEQGHMKTRSLSNTRLLEVERNAIEMNAMEMNTIGLHNSGFTQDTGGLDTETAVVQEITEIKSHKHQNGRVLNSDNIITADEQTEGTNEFSTINPHNSTTAEESEGQNCEQTDTWDPFNETIADTELDSLAGCYNLCRKLFKLIFIIVTFSLVLATLVISKGSLLFIISSSSPIMSIKNLKDNDGCGQSQCIRFWNSTEASNPPYCCVYDRVRWIWALYLCMVTPYCFIFLRSMWKMCFKKKKNPNIKTLLVVLCIETVHTFGLFLLMFHVLPLLDSTRGLFLMTGVITVPSLLKCLTGHDNNSRKTPLKILAFILQFSALIVWPALTATTCPVPPIPVPPINSTSFSDPFQMIQNTTFQPIILNSSFSATENYSYTSSPFTETLYSNITMSDYATTIDLLNQTLDYNVTYEDVTTVQTTILPSKIVVILKLGKAIFPECIGVFWGIPVALLLTSIIWWENFIDGNDKNSQNFIGLFTEKLKTLKKSISVGRTKIYAVVGLWKCLITFIFVLIYYEASNKLGMDVQKLFQYESFIDKPCQIHVSKRKFQYDWLGAVGLQVAAGLLCYLVVDVAIKTHIQVRSFAIPIALATPVSFATLMLMCHKCEDYNVTPQGLYFNCFAGGNLGDLFKIKFLWIGFLWWISQLLINDHLWRPTNERLAKTDKLFVMPMYDGVLLEQSLALNRRRKDKEYKRSEKKSIPVLYNAGESSTDGDIDQSTDILYNKPNDSTPVLFMCATMWHENELEMIQILKSIIRMDEDQSALRHAQEIFNLKVPDYYEFEGMCAHIFFDDAFEYHSQNDTDFNVNTFVIQLINVMNTAARSVHKTEVEIDPPTKYETPYGGRLEWDLPGGNKLIAHLKDKMKIRHRKRWSQVMYMYYFMGLRLWTPKQSKKRKETVADNTFILALDGDVDFEPKAVQLLIDLMKRNDKVAASCGRIHPIGSGPIVWYQKFEYSIAHWFQKATEHVLGCVLCSPGCFSLFRASALMDDNVIKTYTKEAQEAWHYVQYDQGEDRWLCTLLLQQGYRVEYSAAADALTYAPEGFNEFFNQRRRWTPSTFANVLDLLISASRTVNSNENISWLYMIYQGALFGASILGPATIFMLIVGAFQSAFGITALWSFFLTFFPIITFFILCLKAKPDTQLYMASILAASFSIVQMLVLVGIIRQMVEGGICSPPSIFFLFVAGCFLVAAILHPQEFFNITHGVLYYLLIPTMYLLLIIYSLCNLNIVSWGTREVKKSAKEEAKMELQDLEEKKAKEEEKKGIMEKFGFNTPSDNVDGFPLRCGTLCRCFCCLRQGESPEDKKMRIMMNKLNSLEEGMRNLIEIKDIDTIHSEPAQQVLRKNPDTYINYEEDEETDTDNENASLLKNEEMTRSLFPKQIPLISLTPPEMDSPRASKSYTDQEEGETESLYLTPGRERNDPLRESQVLIGELEIDEETRQRHTFDDQTKETEHSKDGPPQNQSGDEDTHCTPQEEHHWIEDKELLSGEKKELTSDESEFWTGLIKKYLYPLDNNKEHQEKITMELKELRNKVVFGFFIIDALFIALILALQLTIGQGADLVIKWNCTDPITNKPKESELEPIGFAFILIFGSILAMQFVGMLVHRLFAFMHIVSTTGLLQPKKHKGNTSNSEDDPRNKLDPREAVKVIKEMQRLETITEESDDNQSTKTSDDELSGDENVKKKKKLTKKLGKKKTLRRVPKTLKESLSMSVAALQDEDADLQSNFDFTEMGQISRNTSLRSNKSERRPRADSHVSSLSQKFNTMSRRPRAYSNPTVARIAVRNLMDNIPSEKAEELKKELNVELGKGAIAKRRQSLKNRLGTDENIDLHNAIITM